MALSTIRALAWASLLAAIPTDGMAQNTAPGASAPQPSEIQRREALKLYAFGLLCERDSRYLEAVRSFEEAVRLDPEAVEIQRALIPLYLALERADDALAASGKVLASDPGDYRTWYLRSRLYRDKGQPKEACDALTKAVASTRLKEQPQTHYEMAAQLALLRDECKDPDGAIVAYTEALKVLERPEPLLEAGPLSRADIDARIAEICERIGTLCLQNRRYEQAVAAYSQAQAKNPPEMAPRLCYHLAKVYLAQGQPAEALKNLNQYLGMRPHGTEAYALKIELLERLKLTQEILPQLRQHAEADPHNVALQLLVAEQYAKARNFGEAEVRYRRLLVQSPSPEAYRSLFALYKQQGQVHIRQILALLDQALAEATAKDRQEASAVSRARALLSALREDPELTKALLAIAVRDLGGREKHAQTTWEYLALTAANMGQPDYAEQFYRQCLLQLTPDMEPQVYGGLLQVLLKRYKYEDIVQVCQKGLKEAQQTNRYLFHRYHALALCRLGKYDEGIAEADRMVELATNDHRLEARLAHAALLSQAEQHDRAIAECSALLKEATQPGEIRDIRYSLATAYTAARQTLKSEEQLRLILQADPDDDTANNDLGYHLADEGRNLDEAEKLIRRAIELERQQRKSGAKRLSPQGDQDHAAFVDSLGWVLFRQGRLEDARRELERATTLPDGENPEIWDHLGDVYLRMKDTVRAKTAWEKAEQLYRQERRRQQDNQLLDLQRKLNLLRNGTASGVGQ